MNELSIIIGICWVGELIGFVIFCAFIGLLAMEDQHSLNKMIKEKK